MSAIHVQDTQKLHPKQVQGSEQSKPQSFKNYQAMTLIQIKSNKIAKEQDSFTSMIVILKLDTERGGDSGNKDSNVLSRKVHIKRHTNLQEFSLKQQYGSYK